MCSGTNRVTQEFQEIHQHDHHCDQVSPPELQSWGEPDLCSHIPGALQGRCGWLQTPLTGETSGETQTPPGRSTVSTSRAQALKSSGCKLQAAPMQQAAGAIFRR